MEVHFRLTLPRGKPILALLACVNCGLDVFYGAGLVLNCVAPRVAPMKRLGLGFIAMNFFIAAKVSYDFAADFVLQQRI